MFVVGWEDAEGICSSSPETCKSNYAGIFHVKRCQSSFPIPYANILKRQSPIAQVPSFGIWTQENSTSLFTRIPPCGNPISKSRGYELRICVSDACFLILCVRNADCRCASAASSCHSRRVPFDSSYVVFGNCTSPNFIQSSSFSKTLVELMKWPLPSIREPSVTLRSSVAGFLDSSGPLDQLNSLGKVRFLFFQLNSDLRKSNDGK